MFCCEECFKDIFIKNTIQRLGTMGNCDFCSAKNVKIIDISNSNVISDNIIELLQLYSISNDKKAKPLKKALRDDWDIFNGGSEGIQSLTKALCTREIPETDEIFNEKVIIPQMYDVDFLDEYSFLRGLSWSKFSENIKFENRFHNTNFNPDAFNTFLTTVVVKYDINTTFFRARICDNINGFDADDMYAPPKEKRRSGRINPEGISVLYLSSDEDTVLYEARANVYDYISIGKFNPIKEIRLVNLSNLDKVSPFTYTGTLEQFSVNRIALKEMSQEIARPMRRNDSSFEYLPTQFIAEFIKSQGYDGVQYSSTIHNGGYNIALFNDKLVNCVDVKTMEITDVKYIT